MNVRSVCAMLGRYHMSDLDKIGGVPVVLREPSLA